jgi:glycogen debranching enzyme
MPESLFEYIPPARKVLAIPQVALRTVTAKGGGGVYASSDVLFRGAVFGRDSLEVAEDLMLVRPRLVRDILLTMGRLQGLENNALNEEEPGKIIHEYRVTALNGKQIDLSSREIFDSLSEKWGGSKNELAYYGSVDSTPHFLRVLGAYCLMHGETILGESVQQRDGNNTTMRDVAVHALSWLQQKLTSSKSGLLEYRRLNAHGIANQVWKDSDEFYVHENKELANHDLPIASIEVQGLVYDALSACAQFFGDKATEYLEQAVKIRDRTIELLWQEDRQYFALGLDYADAETMRIIATPTANPGALLDTEFFDDMEDSDKQKYISAIVYRIMDQDFLTPAGIRSRSLDARDLIGPWDYHGSLVSWPKETYDIAKGMRRQGFPKLSRQLENRLLNVVLKSHEYPEFVYVDRWGRVMTGAPSKRTHGELILAAGHNTPERVQAWTVSAILAIMTRRLKEKRRRPAPIKQEPWQLDLEDTILAHIPHVDRYINPVRLLTRYPTHRYRLTGKK